MTRNISVDGYFEPWSQWSECSVTCATGSQTRQRVCVEPLYAGSECSGPRDEERNCTMVECPGNVRSFLHAFYLFILLLMSYLAAIT